MRSAPPNLGPFPSEHRPLPGPGAGSDVIPWRWPEFQNMPADPIHLRRCAGAARGVHQQAPCHRPGPAEVELRTWGRCVLSTSPRRRINRGAEPGIRRKPPHTSQMRPIIAARPGAMRQPPAGVNAGGARHRCFYVTRLTCSAVGSGRNSLGVCSLARCREVLLRQRRDAEDPEAPGSPPQRTIRHCRDVYYSLRDSVSSHKALRTRALLRRPNSGLVRYLTRGDADSRVTRVALCL